MGFGNARPNFMHNPQSILELIRPDSAGWCLSNQKHEKRPLARTDLVAGGRRVRAENEEPRQSLPGFSFQVLGLALGNSVPVFVRNKFPGKDRAVEGVITLPLDGLLQGLNRPVEEKGQMGMNRVRNYGDEKLHVTAGFGGYIPMNFLVYVFV